jgi:hypothetical protein
MTQFISSSRGGPGPVAPTTPSAAELSGPSR